MPLVNVRIEGEQKGRIIAAFAMLGVSQDKIKFYPKRKGGAGWLGYANVDIKPPSTAATVQEPPAPADPVALFDLPRQAEPKQPISQAEFEQRIAAARGPAKKAPAVKTPNDFSEEPTVRPIIRRPTEDDEFE